MKSLIGVFIGLMLSVSVGAEPLVEGRVRLSSEQPATGVAVRLFDLSDLRRLISATTDEAGHFTLSLQAFSRGSARPQGFALGQNSQTVLSYFLSKPRPVRLEVFALSGQRVAVLHQGPQQAGYHRLHWAGRDDAGHPVASGAYLYRLVTDEAALTRKLILLR